MSPSPLVTPEDVLETLMNDGTIDAIRLKIINQLKANEELKSNTISMVEQSKVLNTTGAEKQTKRELFDALRRELETPVLEKASKAVWELIVGNDGLGKEISETVGKAFFRLSGQEPPQLPMVNGDTQPLKKKDDDPKETQKDKDREKGMKDREKGSTSSASRKRTYEETRSQEIDAAANANTNTKAAAGTAENGMMLPPNEPNPKAN